MKRFPIVASGLCLALCSSTVAFGQDKLTDAMEILKKADAASKAVKSVKYTAKFKGLEAAESRTPNVEGSAVFIGWTGVTPEKWRLKAKVKRPNSADVREYETGSDGENFFLIDNADKKAYEDIDPAVVGSAGRAVRGIVMAEFVHPEPFNDEMTGLKQEFRGTTKVAGEECYEIHVQYSSASQTSDWFFSTKDFLPRRVRRWFPGRDGTKQGSELTITKLEVNPTFSKNPFVFKLPKGFTQIDDFAP